MSGSGFVEEDVPVDPALVDALERLPSLRSRFEAVTLGTPLVGSREFADRLVPYGGDRPGGMANVKMSAALDHLWTWRRIVVDARFIPALAHLTLLRPGVEGSAQARWMLDSTITPRERVGRALGLAVAELDERRGFEADMTNAGWVPSAEYQTAEARAKQIRDSASAARLRLRKPPTRAPNLGAHQALLLSYASGIVHGQIWATLLGESEMIRDGATMRTEKQTARLDVAAGLTAVAVDLFADALGDLEGYVEP